MVVGVGVAVVVGVSVAVIVSVGGLRPSQKARPGPTGPEEVCAEIVVSAIGRDLGAGRETPKRAQT